MCDFRQRLELSQGAFGKKFGNLTRRQIDTYESGAVEVPISLLWAIVNAGYPPEPIIKMEMPCPFEIIDQEHSRLFGMIRQLGLDISQEAEPYED